MMSIWGQDWRLKIYPNGKTGAQGKFMSVFLELANVKIVFIEGSLYG
jgi:hypothetical protein